MKFENKKDFKPIIYVFRAKAEMIINSFSNKIEPKYVLNEIKDDLIKKGRYKIHIF